MAMEERCSLPSPSHHHEPSPPLQLRKIEASSVSHAATPAEEKETSSGGGGDGSGKMELFKTSLCSHYRKRKECRHGDGCRYAHGEEELRPRPDGSWDPTSITGKKKKLSLQQKEVVASSSSSSPAMDISLEDADSGLLHQCILDLPLPWSAEAFKKFLTDQGVPFVAAKKKKHFGNGFVVFEDEEQIATAKQILDGKLVGSKVIQIADAIPRKWEKKFAAASNEADRQDANTADQPKNICDVVTPLAKVTYENQLKQKKDEISTVLKKLTRNVRKALFPGAPLPSWIRNVKRKDGLPCDFLGIITSPIIDGYRNKCEFSVGFSADGKRVVGFQLGSFREGINTIEEPSNCRNVSSTAAFYAASFQRFVQDSKLPVWNKLTNTGFWRLLTVREGRAPCNLLASGSMQSITEVMLVVQVCSSGVEEDVRQKEFKTMAQNLAVAASSACPLFPLTALLVQDHQGLSNAASPTSPLLPLPIPEVLHGSIVDGKYKDLTSHIHEHMCNLRFRLSATSFFQVNTLAAEKLYKLVGDWACLTNDTIIFDICCGTGTIGLALAKHARMVIGIEMNSSAVADAQVNAEINGISNCQFVCAKAEDVIASLLEKYLDAENEEVGTVFSAEGNSKSFSGEFEDTNLSEVSGQLGDVLSMEAARASTQNDIVIDVATDISGVHAKASQETRSENGLGEVKRGRLPNVVAIVDPPRAGLHPVVVRVLRTCKKLRRIVYVSCNPETLLANAVELCTPIAADRQNKKASNSAASWRSASVVGHARQRIKSMPASESFCPVKAIAVDLFPHTTHCEMVMLMER